MGEVGLALSTDSDLAARFRSLFEAELSYVLRTLYRLGVREADLEDLAHDVFVTVHGLLPEYDPSRPVRPWLFGIAYRYASGYRRKAAFTREIPHSELDVVSDSPGVDDLIAAEQTRGLVIRALQELELERRAVVVMHDIDGCAVPEIAHSLKIPLNTAYSRLRVGREQLKAAIRRARLRRGEA